MKRKQSLLSSSAIVVILFSICLALPLRAQRTSDYLELVNGDTVLSNASSINLSFGYEKGVSTSYRRILKNIFVEIGVSYNPFFNDKFLAGAMNLAIMPFSTRSQPGLFYSTNFLLSLRPIETENRVYMMSFNAGWLSQFQKGICYSVSIGPGLKLTKPPNEDVKTSFTINAEVSVGYSF